MGRKIPGKKHRGVRDPAKQRAERFNRIKDKVNAPPVDPDDQQIPKSAQRIAELRARVRSGVYDGKKPKQVKPKKRFEQRTNESNRDFLRRVHQECVTAKRETAFEKKYGVEIKKNEEGEVESIKKRPKDPVQVMLKEARNNKKKKKKGEEQTRLTKSQKRRLKLAEKKKKKKANEQFDDFDKFKDEVKFGEQVHAPPVLTAPKRKIVSDAPRPGTKDLLLKSILNKTANKVIDRTGKRKELPNALRRQLDQQQKEVIEAYRLIKDKKHNTT